MLKRNLQLCDIENKRVPVETILSSCLPRFTNKLFFRSDLILLKSVAKMLKSSKFLA